MRDAGRSLALALAVALTLCSSVAGATASLAAVHTATAPVAVAPRTTLPAIEGQVMCVTCKIPLTVAQSPQASRERAYIQSLIDRGYSEVQIKRSLVYQYGSAVLALPRAHGFDLAAYLVPVAVVLALLATLALLLPRWRRRAGQASAGEPTTTLSPSDAARLDADMARFD
jgi:cytochrome c-type biogenesis protein CcmH